jgi:hypothetical protein
MSRFAPKYPDKRLSVTESTAQMVAFLCNCTDAILAGASVDQLCSRFRVDARSAEYQLTIARQRRAARG